METGDRLSRDGGGVDEAKEAQHGERPSEEAIRNRLIDRRKAFDEAEAGRTLANRFRQKMRSDGASASWSRRALAPVRAMSRAAEGLRNRPIVAFVAAASLSAIILVPLALSSYAPLPGEEPLPAATTPAHRIVTAEAAPTPPLVTAASDRQSDMEPDETAEVRAPIAPPAPDGSIFETLEKEEVAASVDPSASPQAGKKAAAPAAAPTGANAVPGSDPALLETTSLRKVAPALTDGPTGGVGSANFAGAQSIDPVAAALALRLPVEPSGDVAAVPTTLDPAITGSVSPAPVEAGPAEEAAAAPDTEALGMETAGPAKSFIAISPSILIASEEAGRAAPVAAAPAADNANAGRAADEAPASTASEASSAEGRATASVNLRAEPTNDGKIVAVLSKGEAVTVVSCKGWCEVETAGGAKGYVYEKFIARGSQG